MVTLGKFTSQRSVQTHLLRSKGKYSTQNQGNIGEDIYLKRFRLLLSKQMAGMLWLGKQLAGLAGQTVPNIIDWMINSKNPGPIKYDGRMDSNPVKYYWMDR